MNIRTPWHVALGIAIIQLCLLVFVQTSPQPDKTTILAIGDSIMKGGTNWSVKGHRNTIDGGWVTLLQHRLNETFPDQYRVINEGVDADTALGLLKRIDQDAVALEPDIVLIGIGTNDAFSNDILFTPSPTVDEYREVVEEILDTLHQELPDATIVLIGYATPVKEYFAMGPYGWIFDDHTQEDLEVNFAAYNQMLEKIAEESNLTFIDIAMQWPSDYGERWELLADGLHPNDAGHDLISDIIYQALLEAVLHPVTAE